MILIKKENFHPSIDGKISGGRSRKFFKKKKDLSISESFKKDISKGVVQLMKPGQNHDLYQPPLLKEKETESNTVIYNSLLNQNHGTTNY